MTRVPRLVLFASLFAMACGGGQSGVPDEARKAADKLTGDDKGAAADNPQCKLFTPAEAGKFNGERVEAGRNAGMGTGCQWVAADGDGDVMVVVVPAEYHEAPTMAEGYKAISDVGTRGFVAPELGGWAAGAITGEQAVRVSVAGSGASEAMALALLREAIKRRTS